MKVKKLRKMVKMRKRIYVRGLGEVSKGGSLFKIDTIDSSVAMCRPVKST